MYNTDNGVHEPVVRHISLKEDPLKNQTPDCSRPMQQDNYQMTVLIASSLLLSRIIHHLLWQ